MPVTHPFDYLVDGWRIEFKHANPSKGRGREIKWCFRLQSKGDKGRDEKCDFYVFCIDGVPNTKQSLYLLYRPPLRTTGKAISLRQLLRGDAYKESVEFEKFCSGGMGIGPWTVESGITAYPKKPKGKHWLFNENG